MKKILIVVLAMLLIITACTTAPPQQKPNTNNKNLQTNMSAIFDTDQVRNCRITANVADVKSGAGNNFNTIANLGKNTELKVLHQLGNWYVVQLDNNKIGAIDANDATPIVKDQGTQKQPQAGQPYKNYQPTVPQQNQQPQTTQQPKANQQTRQNQQPQTNQNTATPNNQPLQQLTSQEQQMVDLVNQERSKNSVPPLKVDLELARVAEVKAQDMVDKNYFSHNSPTYGSPFDMMKDFGISYLTAGENLAGNSTVQKAHTALMNSSGHRKNILNPDFTHIGIGIKPSSTYGYIFTQEFIGKPQ